MTETLLSTLIEKTEEAVRSFGYKQSTLKQYDRAWRCLKDYFLKHGRKTFSVKLLENTSASKRSSLTGGKSTCKDTDLQDVL